MGARSNTGSTSNYLSGSPPLTAVPLTFSIWFYPAALTAYMNLMGLSDVDVINSYIQMDFDGDNSLGGGDNRLAAVTNQPGLGEESAVTTTTIGTANVWYHCAAVFSAANSRTPYINAGGNATNTVSRTPTNIDTLAVGAGRFNATTWSPVNGRIAEPAIWNVALSVNELTALAAGVPACFVRPESLVFYCPLHGIDSPEPDRKPAVATATRYNLTITGTMAQANGPPLQPLSFRMARRTVPVIGAAAPAGGNRRRRVLIARAA